MKKGESRANQNREIKREEIKRYLAERGRVSYVFDIVEKLEDLSVPLDNGDITRLGKAIDSRLRLLNKYLPDEKSVELKNADGESFKTDNKWVIEIVSPGDA